MSEGTVLHAAYLRLAFVAPRLFGVCAVVLASILTAPKLLGLPNELGEDWRWYEDGPRRLLAHEPLYDSRMMEAPFNYLDGRIGEVWNQAPWAVTLVYPFSASPFPLQAWLLFTIACLVAAFWLVWPRTWKAGDSVLVALALASTAPVIMGMVWGNLQSAVVLGVALYIAGRKRGSQTIMAAGIILASFKVIPALPLIAWSLVRDRQVPPVLIALLSILLLTVPVALAAGNPFIVLDFLVVASNLEAVATEKNLTPALWFPGGVWVLRLAALAAATYVLVHVERDRVALPLLLLLACVTVQNLYADWLLLPMIGFLAALGDRLQSSTAVARTAT